MKAFFNLAFAGSVLAFGLGCGFAGKLTEPKVVKYTEMNGKLQELLDVSYQDKAETVELKGKVAIAIRPDENNPAYLDRFGSDGTFNEVTGLLPPEMYAKKPDEIESLIVIACDSSTESDVYKDGTYNTRSVTFQKLDCQTDVYDYKAKKLMASAALSSGGKSNTISLRPGQDVVKTEFPTEQIQKFLDKIPSSSNPSILAQPGGATVQLEELIEKNGGAKKGIADKYNGQRITTSGFVLIHNPADNRYEFDLVYVDLEHNGGHISCHRSLDEGVAPAFGSLKKGDNKLTITGILKADNYTAKIENCKLVSAERVPEK
jgi:hypothetical protein